MRERCLQEKIRAGLAGVLLGCAALCLVACDEPAVQAVPPVKKDAVEIQTIRTAFKEVTIASTLNGRVRACAQAQVRPQITGIIQKRLFTEGAQVKEGDLLYLIDDRTYAAEYQRARALYLQKKSDAAIAAKRLKRATVLRRADSISEEDFEEATLNHEAAEADLAAALSDLNVAGVNMSYTRIRAPISGEVGMTRVTEGSLVTANQTEPLTIIRNLDQVYVDIQQSSRQWRRLKESILFGELTTDKRTSSVVLYLDGGKEYDTVGQLELSELEVDEGSGNVTLRAIFDNKHHLLVPGMAVQAKVIGGINPHSLVIPAQAILRDPKGQAFAFVMTGDNRVQKRTLKLGILTLQGYEVLEGLQADEEIAVTGLSKLRDGSMVAVKNLVPETEPDPTGAAAVPPAEATDATEPDMP